MKKLLATLSILSLLLFFTPFHVEAATTVKVDAWGGGGGGGAAGGGSRDGGGGGAYAALTAFSITTGQPYTVTVGLGGALNVNGATTTFSATSTLTAAPGWSPGSTIGKIGIGGAIASSTGDVLHAGGKGAVASGAGGSGGGAAGTANDGGNATNSVSCAAVGTVGSGGATSGGNGGKGADNTSAASAGAAYAGGGGGSATGGTCTFFAAAAGANGVVIITAPLGTITSATGGTHTTDATNDIWTFTASGVWTPTFTPPASTAASITSDIVFFN